MFAATVKPSSIVCPLFQEFHEVNKTAKLKGANVCLMITDDLKLLVCYCVFVWSEFAKIKDAKIILYSKLPTFRAAKLKGFTVLQLWEPTRMRK